jgi:anti-sigma regulatory factor (Ser/Thr protein kinase)
VRSATLDIPIGPTAVASARRWAVALCREWDRDDATDVVALLVSELVTNALLYAGRPVRVIAAQPESSLRVEVCDPDPEPPAPRSAAVDPLAERGRGLQLLEALASSWGIDVDRPEGKVVWFEVAAAAEEPVG